MKKKFSKGEWSRKTTKEYSDIYCNGTTIATYWNHMRNEEELEANAKLSAAAPKLLEALNDLVLASDLSSNSPVVGNWNELINNAKNAIKKATE